VEAAVAEYSIDVLLPMTDVAAPLLLPFRDRHPDLIVPFPASDAYSLASDKVRLADIAQEMGVPVPEQVIVSSPDAWDSQGAAALGDHVVVKPARSAITVEGGVRKLSVVIVARDAVSGVLAELPPQAYPVLVQRRVVGPGRGLFVLASDGRMITTFAHRRVREKPPTGGVSVYREAQPVREDLLRYSARLIERLGWSGVAMVEFKEDVETGTPYLMEINGRFWGSLQLAVDAGVDFPRLLVDLFQGRESPGMSPLKQGVRSRWLWGDLDHLIWMLKTPRDVRALHPGLPSVLGAVGAFLLPWRPGDRFEVMRLSDPRPFLRETAQWFGSLMT